MTAEQQLQYLRQEAVPRLSEGGLEAFVLTGYIRLEDGSIQRVCIANTGKNVCYEDGLRSLIAFAHMWSQNPPMPGPSAPMTEGEPRA